MNEKPKHGGSRKGAAAPVGNTNAAKRGIAATMTIRVESVAIMQKIKALRPEQRGAILTEYVRDDDELERAEALTDFGRNDPTEN